MSKESKKSESYQAAGVSLDAAEQVVKKYKGAVASTEVAGVMGGIGGFGGLFSLKEGAPGVEDPILVSGTDGVGTKLKLAFELNKHDSIGIDLVAMCVNDIVTVGAKPLFFLDYLATGKLDPDQAYSVVEGIAAGCREAGCALIGGETAEMPGFYRPNEYDVAGFVVGVVDRKKMLTAKNVQRGDLLVGVCASGFHSNGYSLIRKIIDDSKLDLHEQYAEMKGTLGEELLKPTFIYTNLVLDLVARGMVKSVAHITGGGIYENLPRVLPAGVGAMLDPMSWDVPNVMTFMCKVGNIPTRERYHVFNMGLGLVIVVAAEKGEEVLQVIQGRGFKAAVVGEVTGEKVQLKGIDD